MYVPVLLVKPFVQPNFCFCYTQRWSQLKPNLAAWPIPPWEVLQANVDPKEWLLEALVTSPATSRKRIASAGPYVTGRTGLIEAESDHAERLKGVEERILLRT